MIHFPLNNRVVLEVFYKFEKYKIKDSVWSPHSMVLTATVLPKTVIQLYLMIINLKSARDALRLSIWYKVDRSVN